MEKAGNTTVKREGVATDKHLEPLFSRQRLALAVFTLAACAGLLTFAHFSGGTLEDPVGLPVWEIGITLVAVTLLVIGARQSLKTRKFSPLFLSTVAAASAFWQETYGDWGTYLLYSDSFQTYEWAKGPLTAPVHCWWFIPGYVMFYGTLFAWMEHQVKIARGRWPNANPYLVATLLAFPVFFLFDLVLEGTALGLGFWDYTYIFGPSLPIGGGTFPLLWPVIEQVPFLILVAVAMMWRNSRDQDVFQVIAHKVGRREPGQLAILVSWIVTFNVAFLVATIFPLMLLRFVAGPASTLVP